jgi:hypothetical protein
MQHLENSMKSSLMLRLAGPIACVAVLGGVLGGPLGAASASDASIQAVMKSYEPKILVAEGQVVTALGEYKTSAVPTGVEAAIVNSSEVLRALKAAIAAQPAVGKRVKRGKAKVETGLGSVILGYRQLDLSFTELMSRPVHAKAEAKKALATVKKGSKELNEGAKLLR